MDPLSDVLALLKPENTLAAGFSAGGDWALQFPDQREGIKCGAVVSGRCWMIVDGAPEPVQLAEGDCFVMARGGRFRLASDPALAGADAAALFARPREGGIARLNEGEDFLIVSCRFALQGEHAGMLTGLLPPAVLIRDQPEGTALRWLIERMMHEIAARRPGGALAVSHLAHMLLLQALRQSLAEGGTGGGWFAALADRQLCAAIAAMHGDPGHRWTLAELAGHAGLSRSAFALRFKATVGLSPIDYLTRWRMLLAAPRLADRRQSIAGIAAALGYESESAFSTAYKRVMGRSPRRAEPASVQDVAA